MYDLVVKGGTVLAPGDQLNGRLDIAIEQGKIVRIAPDIHEPARRVVDVRGALVTPGLIDLHTHIDFGLRTEGINARGVDPDLIGVHAGVTTVVDAGTTGPYIFGGFRNYVINRARTRVLCFLHAGRGGISLEPDVRYEDDVDLDAFVKAVELNRDVIVGIKTRLVGPGLKTLGARIVELGREAARRVGLPLMVHTGDHMSRYEGAPEVTRAALKLFERGDIIEHSYTSMVGGMLDAHGRILPEFREAIQRGVMVSAASGGVHLSFRVARIMLEQGIAPSFIATDLNKLNVWRGCYSLTEMMSQFLALGLPLEDVVRLCTVEPAKAIRREDALGHLAVGREADLTVLEVVDGDWVYRDRDGETLAGRKALVPVVTVRAGEIVTLDWGPHPWGWLPEPGGHARHTPGDREEGPVST
jgi:dihydroorotase